MMTIICAGALLSLEYGEYSDKGWSGPFRVLKEIDRAKVLQEFKAQFTPEQGSYVSDPVPDDLIAWLATSGYIEDVPSESWFIGTYSLQDADT